MSKIGAHNGYLIVDHRNSPGISKEEAAAAGVVSAPGGTLLEMDTWTCAHCGAIVLKNPDRLRPREVCRKCMKVVCDNHVLWCEPFEKISDALLDGTLHKVADSPLILPGMI